MILCKLIIFYSKWKYSVKIWRLQNMNMDSGMIYGNLDFDGFEF